MTPLFAIYDYIFGKTNESIPSMREHDMEQSTLNQASDKPTVTIYYCRQCNWMLRASWLSQELLHTFSEELGAVTLCPDTGGRFEIFVMEYKSGTEKPKVGSLKQKYSNREFVILLLQSEIWATSIQNNLRPCVSDWVIKWLKSGFCYRAPLFNTSPSKLTTENNPFS